MKIETKFDIGETCYEIRFDHKVIEIECECCDDGKVILRDNNSYVCPACLGSCKVSDYINKSWVLSSNEEMIVVDITVALCEGSKKVSYEIADKEGWISYCEESNVFGDMKEAIKEINRRNGIVNFGIGEDR